MRLNYAWIFILCALIFGTAFAVIGACGDDDDDSGSGGYDDDTYDGGDDDNGGGDDDNNVDDDFDDDVDDDAIDDDDDCPDWYIQDITSNCDGTSWFAGFTSSYDECAAVCGVDFAWTDLDALYCAGACACCDQ